MVDERNAIDVAPPRQLLRLSPSAFQARRRAAAAAISMFRRRRDNRDQIDSGRRPQPAVFALNAQLAGYCLRSLAVMPREPPPASRNVSTCTRAPQPVPMIRFSP